MLLRTQFTSQCFSILLLLRSKMVCWTKLILQELHSLGAGFGSGERDGAQMQMKHSYLLANCNFKEGYQARDLVSPGPFRSQLLAVRPTAFQSNNIITKYLDIWQVSCSTSSYTDLTQIPAWLGTKSIIIEDPASLDLKEYALRLVTPEVLSLNYIF